MPSAVRDGHFCSLENERIVVSRIRVQVSIPRVHSRMNSLLSFY
jgi:hypothetical protein